MKATGYLTIKPVWSKWRKVNGQPVLESLKIEKVTANKPEGGTFGAAVVKVNLDIPEHVFKPFEVETQIDVKAEEVGKIRVVVEPFTEHDFDVIPDPS